MFLKREFQHFLWLCETLNISQAAELAGIQQAGLSKSLKSLERQCQEALFHRTNRGLKLTQRGQALLQTLKRMEKIWEDDFDRLKSEKNEFKGKVKLGLHPSIGRAYSSWFFPQLMEEFVQLHLEIHLSPSLEAVKSVLSHQLDLGLVVNPFQHPDLVIDTIHFEYISFWVDSQQQKNAHKKVLYYNPDMVELATSLKKVKDYKLVPIADYEMIGSLLQSSQGIGLLPDLVASRFSGLERWGRKLEKISHNLVYRYDHDRKEVLRKLVAFIKQKTAQG